MDSLHHLKCHICDNQLQDFVMLTCNHTICSECLSTHSQYDSEVVVIECTCGLTTNIPKQKNIDISRVLAKTNGSLPSKPSIHRHKTQILDHSFYNIYEQQASRISSKINKNSKLTYNEKYPSQLKQLKDNNLSNYLLNQLNNQVKFMQLRFKRYINQINRFYNKLVLQLNRNYEQLKLEILQKSKMKIQMNQIKCLSTIQSIIQKNFKPKLQRKLIKISKQISKFISNTKIQNFQDKENLKNVNNFHDFNTTHISNLKESKRSSSKKINRHDSCKLQLTQKYQNYLKPLTIKDSKIRKKVIKRQSKLYQCN